MLYVALHIGLSVNADGCNDIFMIESGRADKHRQNGRSENRLDSPNFSLLLQENEDHLLLMSIAASSHPYHKLVARRANAEGITEIRLKIEQCTLYNMQMERELTAALLS